MADGESVKVAVRVRPFNQVRHRPGGPRARLQSPCQGLPQPGALALGRWRRFHCRMRRACAFCAGTLAAAQHSWLIIMFAGYCQREKDRNSKLCVRMLDKMTTVINPADQSEKKFTFDYSYWSHDGERSLPDGYNESAGDGAVGSSSS